MKLLHNHNIDLVVKPESILKLLLCYYNNIKENLNKIPNMERRDLSYMGDYINDCVVSGRICRVTTNKEGIDIEHHVDVSLSKHYLLKDLLANTNPYVKIDNYIFPEYIQSNLNHYLDGPFISSNYIIFYDEVKKIAIVFPCSSIKTTDGRIDDFNLRELNSYVLDNFYRSDFDDLISARVVEKLDFVKDILSHNTLSLKIGNSEDSPNILRLIKENIYSNSNGEIHPFYKWELIREQEKKYNQNEKELS